MGNNVYFVDAEVLSVVETELPDVIKKTGCLCVMLVERSGVVLSSAGEPPLHPNECGVTAAGIYAAMNLMIKATRANSFTIIVPANEAMWMFRFVSDQIFLLAHHPNYSEETSRNTHTVLDELSKKAKLSLSRKSTDPKVVENLQYINDRLDELLRY